MLCISINISIIIIIEASSGAGGEPSRNKTSLMYCPIVVFLTGILVIENWIRDSLLYSLLFVLPIVLELLSYPLVLSSNTPIASATMKQLKQPSFLSCSGLQVPETAPVLARPCEFVSDGTGDGRWWWEGVLGEKGVFLVRERVEWRWMG